MKKIPLLIFCCITMVFLSFSQNVTWEWVRGATGTFDASQDGTGAACDKSGNGYCSAVNP
jgi:hypothetical protein